MDKKTIILRHDFDFDSGLNEGVKLLFDIEIKHNVRSTIFLRHDRGVSEPKYKDFYQKKQAQGWEFGLHLANHENYPEFCAPKQELETVLKNTGLNIYGVAACGGNYRWLDPNGWVVQDSLGLKYICPSSLKKPEGYQMKTALAPGHMTLDGNFLRKYGSKGIDLCISEITEYLKKKDVIALLSHNTWFYQFIVTLTTPAEMLKLETFYDKFISHFVALPEYQFKTYKEYLSL